MSGRDHAATLLSLVRYAHTDGYLKGLASVGEQSDYELDTALAEASAIGYVTAREENARHPLSELLAIVNNHDALVEAMKKCVAVLSGETLHKSALIDALTEARALLSTINTEATK